MAFAGNLNTLPLTDVFGTLHSIRATGVLRLDSKVGSRDVVFEDGEIVGVGFLDTERSPDLARRIALLGYTDGPIADPGTAIVHALAERQAAPADQRQEVIREQALSQIYNLFAWDNADFLFHAQGPDEPDVDLLLPRCSAKPLGLNTDELLTQLTRQQDEWAALRERIASEAMAMGLPFAVTNAPGISSRIGNVVPPGGGTAAVAAKPGGSAPAGAKAADEGTWEWPPGDEPDPAGIMDRETQRVDGTEVLRQEPTSTYANPPPAPGVPTRTEAARKAGDDGAPAAAEPSTGTHELESLLRPQSTAFETPEKRAAQLIGKTLGPYLVVAQLGRGGMAMSFRAKHTESWKPVALKVVPRDRFGKQQAVAQALREATAAAAVQHPNVIACLSVGEAEGWIYIAFELVTGGDLAQEVARLGGRMTEAATVRCGLDCACGLAAIHQAGIIHRDLKPENVFIGPGGSAKLGDFGLAFAGGDRNQALVAAGTPAFMAPEVARGLDPDVRSDLYALGATIFFMATGAPPYTAGNTADLITAVLFGDQPDPRHLCPGLSEGFAAVVRKAMAKDRDRRYATAAELVVDLQLLQVGGDPMLGAGATQAISRPAAVEARPASRVNRTPVPAPPVIEAQPASRANRTPVPAPPVIEAQPASRANRTPVPGLPALEARPASRSDRAPVSSPSVVEAQPASRADRAPASRPAVMDRPNPLSSPSRVVVITHQPGSEGWSAVAAPAAPPPPPPRLASPPSPPARRSGWALRAWHLAVLALVIGGGVWVTALTLSWHGPPTPDEPTVAARITGPAGEHRLVWVGDRLAPLRQVGTVAITAEGATFANDSALAGPAAALNRFLVATGDISLEVELTAAEQECRGPRRILTLCRSLAVRNLALSQSGSALEVRLRTTATSPTGLRPHLVTVPGVVTGRRQTVVFIRQRGQHRLYVDGVQVAAVTVPGDLSAWDPDCELRLGQDPDGGASWCGTLHHLTFYSRALTPDEVMVHAAAALGAH